MIILGIDPGKAGAMVWTGDGGFVLGCKLIDPGKKTPGWQMNCPSQWVAMAGQLEAAITGYATEAVGYEEIYSQSPGNRAILGQEAIILATCGRHGLLASPVNQSRLKSWVREIVGGTWKGQAAKSDMLESLPAEVRDHFEKWLEAETDLTPARRRKRILDLTDAYWIAEYTRAVLEVV